MTSTLKFRSKAICLKMLSQRVVLPAALPPATPMIIFWFGSSTKLFLREAYLSVILYNLIDFLTYLRSNYPLLWGSKGVRLGMGWVGMLIIKNHLCFFNMDRRAVLLLMRFRPFDAADFFIWSGLLSI